MTSYTMIEKLNEQSTAEVSHNFTASSLTRAKHKATRLQTLKGTFIRLLDSSGTLIASKGSRGKWNHVN